MAYERQTWNCGDTITADKLNHMEDGIEEASGGGSGVVFVPVVYNEDTSDYLLDATFEELETMRNNGDVIFANYNHSYQDNIGIVTYNPPDDPFLASYNAQIILHNMEYSSVEGAAFLSVEIIKTEIYSDNDTDSHIYAGRFTGVMD